MVRILSAVVSRIGTVSDLPPFWRGIIDLENSTPEDAANLIFKLPVAAIAPDIANPV